MKELIPAIRQYKHNDGSEGLVIAYDKAETEKAFSKLECNTKITTLVNLRDSIQPDGLINSDAGTKTIMAITNAINKIINREIGNK